MEIKEIRTQVYEYDSISELSNREKELAEKAREVCKNSYSPYSNFRVGAAVLLSNNEIVVGSNQENSAYPSGLCAERVALFYAHSQYPEEDVTTIAIAAFSGIRNSYMKDPIPPCGACRQVMMETQERSKKPVKIILVGEEKIYILNSATDLMPLFFDKKFLNP